MRDGYICDWAIKQSWSKVARNNRKPPALILLTDRLRPHPVGRSGRREPE